MYFFLKIGASLRSDECNGAVGFSDFFSSSAGSTISPSALTFRVHAPDLMAATSIGLTTLFDSTSSKDCRVSWMCPESLTLTAHLPAFTFDATDDLSDWPVLASAERLGHLVELHLGVLAGDLLRFLESLLACDFGVGCSFFFGAVEGVFFCCFEDAGVWVGLPRLLAFGVLASTGLGDTSDFKVAAGFRSWADFLGAKIGASGGVSEMSHCSSSASAEFLSVREETTLQMAALVSNSLPSSSLTIIQIGRPAHVGCFSSNTPTFLMGIR